jgi:hypothetical protein
MGTHGFITFVANGEEKTAYNHFDSYPDGLGLDVLEWLLIARDSVSALREQVKALRVVDPESRPTAEDVERLKKYANQNVSTRALDEWYVLLRATQGDPHAMLDAGVIEDASGFPADSLFAEWGYVVDLDTEVFEVYRGFQTQPHSKGRFANRGEGTRSALGTEYFPVAKIRSWAFHELPTAEEFTAVFAGDDE